MHPSQYHPSQHHHYTHSQHVQALAHPIQSPDRKHILALLSSFTRQDVEVKSEEIEELCCFDRMKKLIGGRENSDEECKRDQANSILIEHKISKLESQLGKQGSKPASPKVHQRAASSTNFRRKSEAMEGLKKECLQKFILHQVNRKERDVEEVRKLVGREVQGQVEELIEDRELQLAKAREENEQLRKRILELSLQIESLKTREAKMKDYIQELQEVAEGKKDTKKTAQALSDNFEDKFRLAFGDCSIEDIKNRLEVAIDRCLAGFDKAENRNQMILEDSRKSFKAKEQRLQKRIQQLQSSENELLGNLRTLKLNKQLSEVEADELGRAKVELGRLQKLILALYTEWHSERGEGEKKLLKMVGCLNETYSYQEMVKYVVEYNRKFSTDQKLNEFLFKVLRGIQKLRRTIYPDQCNQKLDPLSTLDKIEKWVKLRVEVPTLAKKATTNRNSYLTDH